MAAHEMAVVPQRNRISLAQIDAAVTARIGPARVPGNAQPAVFNRQVAMYLAKHMGGWSTTRIGKFYNGRDHSTVCYSIRRIEILRECNPEVDGLLTLLQGDIRNGERALDRQRLMPDEVGRGTSQPPIITGEFRDRLIERLMQRLRRDEC
jgi:hypothetical protein